MRHIITGLRVVRITASITLPWTAAPGTHSRVRRHHDQIRIDPFSECIDDRNC